MTALGVPESRDSHEAIEAVIPNGLNAAESVVARALPLEFLSTLVLSSPAGSTAFNNRALDFEPGA